jgi:hypothetical protein
MSTIVVISETQIRYLGSRSKGIVEERRMRLYAKDRKKRLKGVGR